MLIRYNDVPARSPFYHFADRSLGIEKASSKDFSFPKEFSGNLLAMPLKPSLLAELRLGTKTAIAKYGLHGWNTATSHGEKDSYRSLSLTYNPHHQEPEMIANPHIATLGTRKNPPGKTFYGSVEHHDVLKHSYYDTYGFRVRTPATFEEGLDHFFSGFKRSLIRSRISAVDPAQKDAENFSYNWHRDESVFENLRVVIPLETDETHRLQIEWGSYEKPTEMRDTIHGYHLPAGSAYCFDTHRPHRVFREGRGHVLRIHLVLGISPWLDYLPTEDAWMPNSFFGKKHPVEMLRDGDIHPELGL